MVKIIALMISGMSLKMDNVSSKTWSPGKSSKNLMYPLEATFPVQDSRMLVTMFVLIFKISLEMGYIWSKTRSLGQIIEEHMLITKGL